MTVGAFGSIRAGMGKRAAEGVIGVGGDWKAGRGLKSGRAG